MLLKVLQPADELPKPGGRVTHCELCADFKCLVFKTLVSHSMTFNVSCVLLAEIIVSKGERASFFLPHVS